MKINISSIKKERAGRDFSFRLPVTEVVPEDLALPFYGEVIVEGKISNVGDVLLLEAAATAFSKGECARCLEPLEEEIHITLCEEFFSSLSQNIKKDAYVYEGDLVDIKPLLSDSLILEQPIRTLCKDDCRGLCPVCGTNLNIVACCCEKDITDPRLAVLKRFGGGE